MLQDARGSGGGLSMLGSVVQEASERGGFLGLGVSHYPVPMLMSQPRIVTRALEGVRPELGLKPDDPIVLIQGLTIANQRIMVNRKDAFTTDVEVSFTSAERFTGDFNAKLAALGSIPAANLKVTYQQKDDRTVVAKVSGERVWLAAFSVSEWHDLNMT